MTPKIGPKIGQDSSHGPRALLLPMAILAAAAAVPSLAGCPSKEPGRATLEIDLSAQIPDVLAGISGNPKFEGVLTLTVWAESKDQKSVCAPPWSPNDAPVGAWLNPKCRAKAHSWDFTIGEPFHQIVAFDQGHTYDGPVWVWVEVFLKPAGDFLSQDILVFRELVVLNPSKNQNEKLAFAPTDFCIGHTTLPLRLTACEDTEHGSGADPRRCLWGQWKDCNKADSIPPAATDPHWCSDNLSSAGDCAYCGDGKTQRLLGEDCDGMDLDQQTCEKLGYEGGTLACDATCHFDATRCQGSGICGNRVCSAGQETAQDCPEDCGVLDVSAGDAHTCMVTNSGQVWCWGDNSKGQCGQTTSDQVITAPMPVLVQGVSFEQVSCGGKHTCAVTRSGSVWCWGAGDKGQLGNGTYSDSAAPTLVSGLHATGVSAGGMHTCALDLDGRVWCWGNDEFGQLGDGSSGSGEAQKAPTMVDPNQQLFSTVLDLSTGNAHTCIIDEVHHTWCWGKNDHGQIGNGASTSSPVTAPFDLNDMSNGGTIGAHLQAVSAGVDFTCAANLFDGGVWCWGANGSGQLGQGGTGTNDIPTPSSTGPTARVVDMGTGWGHTCALTEDGDLYCWGDNSRGQLGDGTNDQHRDVPSTPLLQSVTWLAVGGYHTCALTDTGQVQELFCWGANDRGQLGNDDINDSLTPIPIW